MGPAGYRVRLAKQYALRIDCWRHPPSHFSLLDPPFLRCYR